MRPVAVDAGPERPELAVALLKDPQFGYEPGHDGNDPRLCDLAVTVSPALGLDVLDDVHRRFHLDQGAWAPVAEFGGRMVGSPGGARRIVDQDIDAAFVEGIHDGPPVRRLPPDDAPVPVGQCAPGDFAGNEPPFRQFFDHRIDRRGRQVVGQVRDHRAQPVRNACDLLVAVPCILDLVLEPDPEDALGNPGDLVRQGKVRLGRRLAFGGDLVEQ